MGRKGRDWRWHGRGGERGKGRKRGGGANEEEEWETIELGWKFWREEKAKVEADVEGKKARYGEYFRDGRQEKEGEWGGKIGDEQVSMGRGERGKGKGGKDRERKGLRGRIEKREKR